VNRWRSFLADLRGQRPRTSLDNVQIGQTGSIVPIVPFVPIVQRSRTTARPILGTDRRNLIVIDPGAVVPAEAAREEQQLTLLLPLRGGRK
jgi:hypothetical protein